MKRAHQAFKISSHLSESFVESGQRIQESAVELSGFTLKACSYLRGSMQKKMIRVKELE